MKSIRLLTIIVASLATITSIIAIPFLDDQIATHWGISGEADGFMSKEIGVLFVPILIWGLWLLLTILPKIDPLKENFAKSRRYYDIFVLFLVGFLAYIQAFLIAWNLGYEISSNIVIPPALAALYLLIGYLLPKIERNWFMGIRTPWTISSDKVWRETHRLGGRLFIVCGVISLLSVLFADYPNIMFSLLIFPILLSTLLLFIYSYYLYKE